MARVCFTRNLQRHVTCPPAEVGGSSVRSVLDAVFGANPRARGYVLDDRGALRKHMSIYVNGELVRDRDGLSDTVPEGAEVYVFQALSGRLSPGAFKEDLDGAATPGGDA